MHVTAAAAVAPSAATTQQVGASEDGKHPIKMPLSKTRLLILYGIPLRHND